MSAIVGIYNLEGLAVERAVIEQMVTTLAHRGPDGAGVWNEGCVGLGHRMLWTTPESLHETLPLLDKAREVAITADARIDNRDELLEALNIRSELQGEVTDSQLILAAYIKWGEDCPQHLLGDFSFVIWDGHKQQLFCARDHFGVKPFYYYYEPGKFFAFATEIKALLCLPQVPRRLNEVRVADHLLPYAVLNDRMMTFYEDIMRLPAANVMTIEQSRQHLRPYWALDPERELPVESNEEYAQQCREIFTEAVRCRMRRAFPISSMLSGGLDSSSITCVARNLLKNEEKQDSNLITLSAVFDKIKQCDESPYIDEVLALGQLEPHYLHADHVSSLTDLERVFWHQDETIAAGNMFVSWCLYQQAQQQGARVVLEGFDGDTTISHGYGYMNELAHKGRWLTLAVEVREYTKIAGFKEPWTSAYWLWVKAYGLGPMMERPPFKQARQWIKKLRGQKDPQPTAVAKQANLNDGINYAGWDSTLNPEFARRISGRAKSQAKLPTSTTRQEHYNRLTAPSIQGALELLDRVGGAFGVEPRFPFCDKRLAEFCLALPAEQKRRHGWSRLVMRRAMDGILPHKVCWRGDKSDLGPSFAHRLLELERDRMEDVIIKGTGGIEKYLDISALRKSYHRFLAGEASEDEVLTIWRGMTLAVWLQHTGLAS
jgi:asparagine synthase (glutamine-hydrolysing)